MVNTLKHTIQILVEPGNRRKLGASAQSEFDIFRYSHSGPVGNRFTKMLKRDGAADTVISVFRFSDMGQRSRVQKLIKRLQGNSQHLIAITSPIVYNQPKGRSLIDDAKVGVLVEEPETFTIEHLAPWIAEFLKRRAKVSRGTVAPQTRSEALDLSARLRAPSGLLDARKFVELLGISSTNLATKVCGVSKQALSQNPTSAGIQAKLHVLEEVAGLLFWCGGDETKLRAWLNKPNRDFASIKGTSPSPMDLILLGHAEIVAQEVHNLRVGNPS